MLAVESGRVCNMSPENTATDFGTSLPFNQASPFVYNMADAVSPASIICAGNAIASKQHTADRNADCDMGSDHSAFLNLVNLKPVKDYTSMRLFPLPYTPKSLSRAACTTFHLRSFKAGSRAESATGFPQSIS